MRPDRAAEEETQGEPLSPHPQVHGPWHRREQHRGCSIYPHGQKPLRSPPTGDTQKAQSRRALVSDAKICPAPLPHTFHTQAGTKQWARKSQNPAAGNKMLSRAGYRFPCAVSDCTICLSISQQKLKVSQVSITPRSLLLSVRWKG